MGTGDRGNYGEALAARRPGNPLGAFASVTLLLAVAACSVQPNPTPDPVTSAVTTTVAPINASMAVKGVLNVDGTVSVHATSNLPDGTELLGTVSQAPTGSPKRYNGYQGGVTQRLTAGAADFGPYSKQGFALPEGKYEITVTMPIAVNQPESVKAIIGEHGENLTGPLVSQSSGNAFAMAEATLTVK